MRQSLSTNLTYWIVKYKYNKTYMSEDAQWDQPAADAGGLMDNCNKTVNPHNVTKIELLYILNSQYEETDI